VGNVAVTWNEIDLAKITKEEWDSHVQEAEKLDELTVKLHHRAYETGAPTLKEAYHRAVLRYVAEVAVLESAAPGYTRRLREVILGRAAFLYDKLEAMRRIEKKGKWSNRLRAQLKSTLMLCEALHDQVAALDRQLSRPKPPEARKTRWGIPIPDGWSLDDPVFLRHPNECDCFRYGVLHCGVPCVWAWPPGAKIGDKAMRLREV